MPVLERVRPMRELDLMERRMRRLFSSLRPPLLPAADVYETEGEFVFEVEVPGFAERELDVEVSDHMLVVKGERKEETDETRKTVRLHERMECSFERTFALPPEADTDHPAATFEKGVLTVKLPKIAEAKRRKIEIAGS